MANGWFILMSLCVISVTAAPGDLNKAEKKRGYQGRCFTSEGIFDHGQIVATHRSPCLKYRCMNGRLNLFDSACPHYGACHPVGSVWTAKDCHTYVCRQMDYNSYRIDRLQSACKDAYGRCRKPGETFPYPVNGRIYRGCSCTTTPQVIRYHCNHPGARNRWQRELTETIQKD